MKEILLPIISWYMGHINYTTICLLMAIESSFIPFPSEVVIPPAAWKAAQGELGMAEVIASATIGALVGAVLNYYLALLLGRRVVYALSESRLAHVLLLNREAVEKAEAFFLKHGNSSTFIGRLVPVIRQLISLPAGFARMNLASFLLYTTLGAGIWNIVLALLGFYLYSQKELLDKYFNEISKFFLGLGILFVAYIAFKSLRRARRP